MLCLGVILLLAFWVVAVVTTVGTIVVFSSGSGGLWVLLGIPLGFVLLVCGFGFCLPFNVLEPEDGPFAKMFSGALVVAVVAWLPAVYAGVVSGPQVYQEHYGEETTAIVTRIDTIGDGNGGVFNYVFHIRDEASGDDLGVLAEVPEDRDLDEGDRVKVVVDPHGLVPAVVAGQSGPTTVSAIILASCVVVVALAALTSLLSALAAAILPPENVGGGS